MWHKQLQKVKFLSKNSILTKPQYFHPKFFLTIFLVKSKMSIAKKPKTTTFSRVFHPKNRQFSLEIKVEFLDKKWRFRTVCFTNIIFKFHLMSLSSFSVKSKRDSAKQYQNHCIFTNFYSIWFFHSFQNKNVTVTWWIVPYWNLCCEC